MQTQPISTLDEQFYPQRMIEGESLEGVERTATQEISLRKTCAWRTTESTKKGISYLFLVKSDEASKELGENEPTEIMVPLVSETGTRLFYRDIPLKDSPELNRTINFVYMMTKELGYSQEAQDKLAGVTAGRELGATNDYETAVLIAYDVLKNREVLERPMNGMEGVKLEVEAHLEDAGVEGEALSYIHQAAMLLVADKMTKIFGEHLRQGDSYKTTLYNSLDDLRNESAGRNPSHYVKALGNGIEKMIGGR